MLSRLKTIIALMRNPKVSKLPKVLVVGAILYILMPVVGWLDDLMFLIGALGLLLGASPRPKPVTPTGPVIDVTPERPGPEPPPSR